MNVKLHTPKTLKAGSGLSSMKQFLLSLIATTVSIVLTFGTAAVIDHNKQETAKKEMAKMIIYDFNKTIKDVMIADTTFREASRLQQELAEHPEYFDSLRYKFIPVVWLINTNFSETTEKIFSSSIETFSTIGDVNFVNEVSEFYLARSKYKETVLDSLRYDVKEKEQMTKSLKSLFSFNFPDYALMNHVFLLSMIESRDKCMQMMHISEKEMEEFSQQRTRAAENLDKDALEDEAMEEFRKADSVVQEAWEKYKD